MKFGKRAAWRIVEDMFIAEDDLFPGEKLLNHQRMRVFVQRLQGFDAAKINIDGELAVPLRRDGAQKLLKSRRRVLSVQDHEEIHVVVRHAVGRSAALAASVAAAERDGANRGGFRRGGKGSPDAVEGVLDMAFNTGISGFGVRHGRRDII